MAQPKQFSIFSNLRVAGALILDKDGNDFPSNPLPGTLLIKGQSLFAFLTINGYQTWFPLFENTADFFVHTQSTPSIQWDVNHNLHSTAIWWRAQDDAGTVITDASKIDVDLNNFKLNFNTAQTGTVIVIGNKSMTLDTLSVKLIQLGANVVIDEAGLTINGQNVLTGFTQTITDGNLRAIHVANTETLQLIPGTGITMAFDDVAKSITFNAPPVPSGDVTTEQLNNAINTEADIRSSVDSGLLSSINNEVTRAGLAESALSTLITNETDARTLAIANAISLIVGGAPVDGNTLKKLYDQVSTIQTLIASDDVNLDTIQEIVDLIKNNSITLEDITVNKINRADIIDSLTSTDSTLVLSANQGRILKELLDAEIIDRNSAIATAIATEVTNRNNAIVSAIENIASISGAVQTVAGKTGPDVLLNASDVGAVAISRTVNGHSLSTDVTVTASDVGLGNVTNVAQLPNTQTIVVSGDVSSVETALNGGLLALTLASVSQSATGEFLKVTLDNKGRVTGNAPVLSSDIATALGSTAVQNATLAANVTTNANLTGMVTSVGNTTTVVTNANLTGEVTSVGNAATLSNDAVINKTLVGFSPAAGEVTSSDSILSAIEKVAGNIDLLTGAIVYQGTWNATTNTPEIASGVGTKGYLFKVSVAGTTDVDSITNWAVGDSIVFDGTSWGKIDGGLTEVVSVAGRTGAIDLTSTDVGLGNVSNVAQLPNTQMLAISGDITATATALNTGTIAASLTTIIQGNAGNFVKIVLDAKGRVVSNTPVTQSDITNLLGVGSITNTMLANTALGSTSGVNTGDETTATIKSKLGITTLSGANTGDQTITLTGDVTGTGTGSFVTALANVVQTNTGAFVKVVVDDKGRVTGNTAVTAADIITTLGNGSITNAMLTNTAVANLSGTNTGDETNATIISKLGFAPVQQGGGANQTNNKVYIGWSVGTQLRLQVDSSDFGNTWPISVAGNALSATNVGGGAYASIPYQVGPGATTFLNRDSSPDDSVLTLIGGNPAWGVSRIVSGDDNVNAATMYPLFSQTINGRISFVNTASTKFTFNPSTGTLFATNVGTSSDLRLKKNVAAIEDPFEILNQLQGIGFNWQDTGRKSYGFGAQDLEKVLPELVETSDEDRKSVLYTPIIAFLVEAVKDLKAQVDALTAQQR